MWFRKETKEHKFAICKRPTRKFIIFVFVSSILLWLSLHFYPVHVSTEESNVELHSDFNEKAIGKPHKLSKETQTRFSHHMRRTHSHWKSPCSSPSVSNKPFCDQSKSFSDRTYDLVYNQLSSLSKSNEIYQSLSGNAASAVPELNIPSYNWGNEALHGLARSPGMSFNGVITHTTMYPQVITTAATFNRTLFRMIGEHISTEARAMWNNGQSGLTFWSPNVNIFRDPRWGRGQETPGEDPFLTSVYAGNFVNGMQGNLSTQKYLKVSSCCKHFAYNSMEKADGYSRHNFNAITSAYDENDTYLVAFKYCVTVGNVSSFMCSYNAETIDGKYNNVPSCANHDLLTKTLRNTWGFNGYITGDCGAVTDVHKSHHFTKTNGATVNVTFSAGMDLDCGTFSQKYTAQAIADGSVELSTVQASIYRATLVQMRLGMFDSPSDLPWSKLGPSDVCTNESLALAYEAAQQGIVLLKNLDNILPLSQSSIKSISLIGPNANNVLVMKGNYFGNPPFVYTVNDGLKTYVSNIDYHLGCRIDVKGTSNFKNAINSTKNADVTILVMGLDQTQESEAHDRSSIELPGVQNSLIAEVSAVSKGPVILVILSGGCVDISKWRDSSLISGILWGGYPGMYGGQAIADVIFGTFSPTGRLDQTWYYSTYTSEVKMVNMDMRPTVVDGPYGTSPGRGYRYFPGSVVYSFGSGLSYTTFSCSAVILNHNLISTEVKNIGSVGSGGVVLVYWIPTNAGKNGVEIKRLVAFENISLLSPGNSVKIHMEIYPEFYGSKEQTIAHGSYILNGICSL